MRDKQIWELTASDLHDVGVWCFPMDESVEDECTVRPCVEEVGLAMIVRAEFCDADGTRFLGYVHWSLVEHIGHRQPTLFLKDGTSISFWGGIVKPSWDEASDEAKRISFPITFMSEPLLGLTPMVGFLEGMYYLDSNDQISCLSIGER